MALTCFLIKTWILVKGHWNWGKRDFDFCWWCQRTWYHLTQLFCLRIKGVLRPHPFDIGWKQQKTKRLTASFMAGSTHRIRFLQLVQDADSRLPQSFNKKKFAAAYPRPERIVLFVFVIIRTRSEVVFENEYKEAMNIWSHIQLCC